MKNIEIWASGRGTNADAIASYFSENASIRVSCIGCNRREAGAFAVAEKYALTATYWSKDNWSTAVILKQLKLRKIDFIVLAGFLKLVPAEIIREYSGKIINIHPSLLPAYGGKDMYGENVHAAVLAAKEENTGITIHEVNEEFDKGKLLAQYTAVLSPDTETMSSVKQKIQRLEHTHFAPTIEAWILAKTRG